MRHISRFAVLFAVITLLAGCYEHVPGGYVGRVRTSTGFNGEVLSPGAQTCYGRDVMYLLEISDHKYSMHVAVLCLDNLNFKFDVSILAAPDRANPKALQDAFENVTPSGKDGNSLVISGQQLYEMYVEPVVDQEARKVISKYETAQIVARRPAIVDEVRAAVLLALDQSLVKVKLVTLNNDDFPEVVTKAQEAKAKANVEIQTEIAEQQKRLIREENTLKIEDIKYKQQLIEAAMVADFNKIVGASITPGFLAWWQMKVFGEAAAGPNNWGFIPYNSFGTASDLDPSKWTSVQGALDSELIKRIQDARAQSTKQTVTPQGQPETPVTPSTPTTPPPPPTAPQGGQGAK